MFEIEGADISKLTTASLRRLVARLCEAELSQLGLPTSAVTAGGDDSAPDGGIDVRVALPARSRRCDFVPRPRTGFQVKTSDMPGQRIRDEMRPSGRLRPAIKAIRQQRGAYIIVSGRKSLSATELERRLRAMHDALGRKRSRQGLTIDFYDRDRIASWVRHYPGLVALVRSDTGRRLLGWSPLDRADLSPGSQLPYLLDDLKRLSDNRAPQEGPLDVAEGMGRVRRVLASPGGTVRLLGLSGTGKTRFAQALCDSSVGKDALDPATAVYADLASNPEPHPSHLIREFIDRRVRAVMVVDNCPPEAHRSLATLCSASGTTVSIMTIEFDMQDDDPEGTDLFWLEPASERVVELMLNSRKPELSQLDRIRIAEHSGGNARVALALAHSVRRGGSVSDLSDLDLYRRLFYQRRQHSDSLQRVAEVCALVYSFNEQLDGDRSELGLLVSIAQLSVDDVRRHLRELASRGLLQRRGRWAAILPHALANRLAKGALEDSDPVATGNRFLREGSGRLLTSFSRRLGFLHDSPGARHIVSAWMAPGGALGDLLSLESQNLILLRYLAPVAPSEALAAFERALEAPGFSPKDPRLRFVVSTWTAVIAAIAFDAELFPRAAKLLARLAITDANANLSNAKRLLGGLFHLYLSGTHAQPTDRLNLAQAFERNDDMRIRELGAFLLGEMLEAWHFSSNSGLDFGARTRDYGWRPVTSDQIRSWYRAPIGVLTNMATESGELSHRARSILSSRFRGLWVRAQMEEELAAMIERVGALGFWRDGLAAVRTTIAFDRSKLSAASVAALRRLEGTLKPQGLANEARAYLHQHSGEGLGVIGIPGPEGEEDFQTAAERGAREIQRIGEVVATSRESLRDLLTDTTPWDPRVSWPFGTGLAGGCDDPDDLWEALRDRLQTSADQGTIGALRGFLRGLSARDVSKADRLLDAAISDSVLGPWFPLLQIALTIDANALSRLNRSLDLGIASIEIYRNLGLGRAMDHVTPEDMSSLVTRIAQVEGGLAVAIDVFSMHLHGIAGEVRLDEQLSFCGQSLAQECDFSQPANDLDYGLGVVVERCFRTSSAADAARRVCRRLVATIEADAHHADDYQSTVRSLFSVQCEVGLDEFIGSDKDPRLLNRVGSSSGGGPAPIDTASTPLVLRWAQVDATRRFPALARVVTAFSEDAKTSKWHWTELGLRLLAEAPDPVQVLSAYARRFRPNAWSGSFAECIERRRILPQTLFTHEDPRVASWATDQDEALAATVRLARVKERESEATFE